MFMGVNSCTGPIVKEELQTIMLMMVEGEFMATLVSSKLHKAVLPLNTHTGKNTKSQLKYSLYLILLGLVVQVVETYSRSYWTFTM